MREATLGGDATDIGVAGESIAGAARLGGSPVGTDTVAGSVDIKLAIALDKGAILADSPPLDLSFSVRYCT